MGSVDELVRAREAYDRRDWVAAYGELSAVDPTRMDPTAFATLATVAYLLGRKNDCVHAFQRAYRAHLDAEDRRGAVRCAFWLARTLLMSGEAAVGGGWVARAQRLLDDEPDDVVERGYLHILTMYRHLFTGDLETALELAVEVEQHGRRFHDPDLVAMGLATRGRLLLYRGRVIEGVALLDEAMASVAAGEVSICFAGDVYCTLIEACQEISDLARAAEWTAALSVWCDAQPGLVAYTGQCAVHRGQIMRLHGAYDEALAELDLAVERYVRTGTQIAAGLALKERGDILRIRGQLDEAEAAYQRASGFGHDPQPGPALLWLAQGRVEQALAAARRLVAEPRDAVHRSQLLPGLVEIFLLAGAVDEAETVSAELTALADGFGCVALRAMAADASAGVLAARGEPLRAVPVLRRAARMWTELAAPYEVARCRLHLGRALRALGDERSARTELIAAREEFTDLQAWPIDRDASVLLARDPPDGLSRREVEVLRLAATGMSNQQIARSLVLSEKTVARHLSNIFTKLGVTSRTAAAAYAYEHDLA
jgi:ATP/maltotriose-dependent transcriptional regulator MalT